MSDALQTQKVMEEHVEYVDDTLVDRRPFEVTPTKPLSTSMELLDAGMYSITDEANSSESSKDSIRIIPNDRQIPISLQDDVEKVLGIAYLDRYADTDSKLVNLCLPG